MLTPSRLIGRRRLSGFFEWWLDRAIQSAPAERRPKRGPCRLPARMNCRVAWSAAGLRESERGFRKIGGYRMMPILVAALRAHDEKFDRAANLDDVEKAA